MGFGNWKGLDEATAEGSRNAKLDRNGDYACVVTAVKEVPSEKNDNEPSFVIELTVLESDNPEIRVNEDRTITINRLTSKVEWKKRLAFGNLKGFLAAVLTDINQEPVSTEGLLDGKAEGWGNAADACTEKGMADGAKFRVKIFRKETEKSKTAAASGASTSEIEKYKFAEPSFRPY